MLCSIVLCYLSKKFSGGSRNAGFTYNDVQTVLLCVYVLLSLSVSVISLMLNASSSYMKSFCYDNAIALTLVGLYELMGFSFILLITIVMQTETGGLSFCVIQAGMIVYTFFAISLNFLLMFVTRFISLKSSSINS